MPSLAGQNPDYRGVKIVTGLPSSAVHIGAHRPPSLLTDRRDLLVQTRRIVRFLFERLRSACVLREPLISR